MRDPTVTGVAAGVGMVGSKLMLGAIWMAFARLWAIAAIMLLVGVGGGSAIVARVRRGPDGLPRRGALLGLSLGILVVVGPLAIALIPTLWTASEGR